MKYRYILALLLIPLLVGTAWLWQPARSGPVSARLSIGEALQAPEEGFARVTGPRPLSFPADHGPHQEYKTEWWYYTGNLESADGRKWGFQLTFFRNALAPDPAPRESAWGAKNIYMAHFALTDVGGGRFYAAERFSRDGAGLAGARAEPFEVWTESWEARGEPAEGTRLRARHEGVAIDLLVRSTTPPVLQGEQGFSQKSDDPGNASFYYSHPRMEATGTITVDDEQHTVRGLSWMDHEWGTGAISVQQTGWDWFALHLSDGSDVMWGQLRQADGSVDVGHGSLASPAGVTILQRGDVQVDVLDRWTSPRSGATYPSRWRLTIPSANLELTIEPHLADQELPLSILYWEGAVKFSGTRNGAAVSGDGYIEMTGYETR